jgi:hypothetical protein
MMWRLALVGVVLTHYLLVGAMALSIPLLFMYESWYVALPLSVWIVNLSIIPMKCPLTTLENCVRIRLGLAPIRSFIKHWVLLRN